MSMEKINEERLEFQSSFEELKKNTEIEKIEFESKVCNFSYLNHLHVFKLKYGKRF